MKLWTNLSKEQKKMAKIAIFNTLMTSIIIVIIKPIVKDEPFIIADTLIEFVIFALVLFAFNCIFITGARKPKQEQSKSFFRRTIFIFPNCFGVFYKNHYICRTY